MSASNWECVRYTSRPSGAGGSLIRTAGLESIKPASNAPESNEDLPVAGAAPQPLDPEKVAEVVETALVRSAQAKDAAVPCVTRAFREAYKEGKLT